MYIGSHDAVVKNRFEKMPEPEEIRVMAWARLVRSHRMAYNGVETALKEAGFPPLVWYDALLELRRKPVGIRINELEAEMLIAQYNISRLVDRLEDAGYLEKTVDPSDGRGRILRITPSGKALLKKMWPVYRQAINDHFGSKISKPDANRLHNILKNVAWPEPGE